MNAINRMLSVTADWLLAPLAAWPLLALLAYSVIVGVLMSLVFKYVSHQRALADVLDRSRGHMLAIKLFKDDLRGMFRSVGNVFLLTFARLCYSIVPVLVMIVPLIFLLSQLHLRYEFRPLASGEQAIVELKLNEEAWKPYRDAQPETNSMFSIETAALRDEDLHSIYWRIRVKEPGRSSIRWQLGDDEIEKSIVAAADLNRLQQISNRRPGVSWWDRTWYAGEPSFAGKSPAAAAVVHYPRRETPFFGFRIPWWVTFLAVSIAAAMAVQPVLKVRF
jgi:hypothetical protein